MGLGVLGLLRSGDNWSVLDATRNAPQVRVRTHLLGRVSLWPQGVPRRKIKCCETFCAPAAFKVAPKPLPQNRWIALGRGDQVACCVCVLRNRLNFPSGWTRNTFACNSGGISPISHRNKKGSEIKLFWSRIDEKFSVFVGFSVSLDLVSRLRSSAFASRRIFHSTERGHRTTLPTTWPWPMSVRGHQVHSVDTSFSRWKATCCVCFGPKHCSL